jgi:hypothetical protein
MNQAHEDADGGGFARAVGADESHDAAGGQFQIDVVEGEVRVAFAH